MTRYSSKYRLIIITLCLLTTIYFVCYLPEIVFSADRKSCIICNKEQKTSKLSFRGSKSFSDKIQWEHKALRKVLNAALNVTTNPILVTVVNEGYVTLAQNWLCNTIEMGIHSKVLLALPTKNKPLCFRY